MNKKERKEKITRAAEQFATDPEWVKVMRDLKGEPLADKHDSSGKTLEQDISDILYSDSGNGQKTADLYELLASQRHQDMQRVMEWAKSTEGATAVDIRGRRFVDLDNLLSALTSLFESDKT